ncbi:serine hydrolase domain-containing protein [Bradyrhizobium diversitatis]|uniref:Serine hydrolase n=1 Tax=Bradyrhizobium diversitatis TaxID=2755406 RepID=A0ABS0PEY7_9BRAD|nr:serine hydrolase [Bradyrhizobium diversitatis]MBH5391865.1 serine hydrolase [Bradyrhizobium diversitatis]
MMLFFLSISVLSVNLLGDGLREALDPRMAKELQACRRQALPVYWRNPRMPRIAERELTPVLPQDRAAMPRADDQLRWTTAEKFVAHRNMHHLFPRDVVPAGNRVHELETVSNIDVAYSYEGKRLSLETYFSENQTTALLVLKRGKIVLERYAHGNDASTRWASRSMAKSFTSTLVGAAVRDGAISSVDDQVVKYVPELRGSLYDGVSLRQALQMVSGVSFIEDYKDPNADVYTLQACTVGRQQGAFLRLLAQVANRTPKQKMPPGNLFYYSSLDSILCGIVVERATGKRPAAYLSERIWQPYGMEADGFWNTEADGGTTFTASGIGAILRDYARFGQFVLDGGKCGDTQVLPEWWMHEATRPSEASLKERSPYGFQWWLHNADGVNSVRAGAVDPARPTSAPVPMRGAESMFYALGNAGQSISINPAEGIVIVKWAAWKDSQGPNGRGRHADASLFAALIGALA